MERFGCRWTGPHDDARASVGGDAPAGERTITPASTAPALLRRCRIVVAPRRSENHELGPEPLEGHRCATSSTGNRHLQAGSDPDDTSLPTTRHYRRRCQTPPLGVPWRHAACSRVAQMTALPHTRSRAFLNQLSAPSARVAAEFSKGSRALGGSHLRRRVQRSNGELTPKPQRPSATATGSGSRLDMLGVETIRTLSIAAVQRASGKLLGR